MQRSRKEGVSVGCRVVDSGKEHGKSSATPKCTDVSYATVIFSFRCFFFPSRSMRSPQRTNGRCWVGRVVDPFESVMLLVFSSLSRSITVVAALDKQSGGRVCLGFSVIFSTTSSVFDVLSWARGLVRREVNVFFSTPGFFLRL